MNIYDVLWGVLIALVLLVVVQYLKHGSIKKALVEVGDDFNPLAKQDEKAPFYNFHSHMSNEYDSGNFESKLAGQLREHLEDYSDSSDKLLEGSYQGDDDYTDHILKKNVNPEVVKNHSSFVKDRKRYSRQPNVPADDLEFSYVNYQGLGRRNVNIKQDSSARSIHSLKDSDYTRTNWNFNFG